MREKRANAGLILRITEHVLCLAVFVGDFIKRLYLHDPVGGAGIFCGHFYSQKDVVGDVDKRETCDSYYENALHLFGTL